MKLLLDTNILTRLCHPMRAENRPVAEWLAEILATKAHEISVCVPEIADYEARRGLLHVALRSGRSTTKSLEHLDCLGSLLTFIPIDTPTLKRAALLWAETRYAGRPTAGPETLDGDVILAAQALQVSGVVVTENVRHLGRLAPAYAWQDVPLVL